MNFLVIYAGRYHPFHRGHKATYDHLTNKFGGDSVYVATSNLQAPVTSPFSFADKQQMINALEIPTSHLIQVKSPYSAQEYARLTSDPDQTVLVFAVSEKDMQSDSARFRFGQKRDGSPTYLQPLPDDPDKCKPMTEHAYVDVVPTVRFKILGQEISSATELRKLYQESNATERSKIIQDLYGQALSEMQELFDRRLATVKKAEQVRQKAHDREQTHALSESVRVQLVATISKIVQLERKIALAESAPFRPFTRPGYRLEK